MARFPGGWLDLMQSEPIPITDVIMYANIGPAVGNIMNNTNYNMPSGTYQDPHIVFNSMPTIAAINASTYPEEAMVALEINTKTQIANLNAPPPLKNLVYLYGNKNNQLKYKMQLPFLIGSPGYDSIQLSILENAARLASLSSFIQVYDFGTGPFPPVILLELTFCDYFGEIHLGLRFTFGSGITRHTSIYNLRAFVLPIPG